MESQTFFPGSNRRVILGSPTLQSTSRRICLPIRMPLSGESFVGMPDWIGEAFEAVSKYLTEASPETQQVADLTLAFANDKPKGELFAQPSAKAPGSELKAFSVIRVGNPDEDPEVEMQFKAYVPFSRDFWGWIGEMAGKEVYMAFPSNVAKKVAVSPAAAQPKLIDDTATPDEEAILAGDRKPEAEPGSPEFEAQVRDSLGAKAAGPRMVGDTPKGGRNKDEHRPRKTGKELEQYNAEQSAKESKRGRGKLTVN